MSRRDESNRRSGAEQSSCYRCGGARLQMALNSDGADDGGVAGRARGTTGV